MNSISGDTIEDKATSGKVIDAETGKSLKEVDPWSINLKRRLVTEWCNRLPIHTERCD